jgi:hypothetical protein
MPDLDSLTTWVSHIKNMEEETGSGRSDTDLEPILHMKIVCSSYTLKHHTRLLPEVIDVHVGQTDRYRPQSSQFLRNKSH